MPEVGLKKPSFFAKAPYIHLKAVPLRIIGKGDLRFKDRRIS